MAAPGAVEQRLTGVPAVRGAGSMPAGGSLDVGYLAAGAASPRPGRWRGDGVAVVVQDAFLLLLDATAARVLRA